MSLLQDRSCHVGNHLQSSCIEWLVSISIKTQGLEALLVVLHSNLYVSSFECLCSCFPSFFSSRSTLTNDADRDTAVAASPSLRT